MAKGLFGRVLPLLFLAAVLMVALAACGGGGGSGGGGGGGEDITVASDIAYPPFEFERDGEPVGFDIDLLNEVGKRAGFTPEYQNVTFDGIIGGLANGQYDAAISSMTITPDREKRIDFSEPYFNADQSLLAPGDAGIESVDDLGDATVGVQLGTTGEITANEFKDEGTIQGDIRTFDTIEDAFNALENGQIEAIINDLAVSQYEAENSGGNAEIIEVIPTEEQYGIALPKDSELRADINKALQEIKDDGTYEEIYKKWIGRAPEEIPE